nr:hypothetical protein [Ramlibacter tataouinensis]
MQASLEWTQVRAPVAGRTGRARVTAGNLVTAGDGASILTTLVSVDQVHVYFDADEATYLRFLNVQRKGVLYCRCASVWWAKPVIRTPAGWTFSTTA